MQQSDKPGYLLTVNWPITGTGGVNEVVLSLAKELRLLDYQPIIAASESTSHVVRGTEVIMLGINPPLTKTAILRPLMGFAARFPLLTAKWLSILRQRDIRILNAHYPDLSVLFFVMLKMLSLYHGRILLSFHGADVQELHQTAGFSRKAWRLLIKSVDANTTCSNALRKELLSFEPDARVVVVHNGADSQLFRFPERPKRKRRTLIQVAKFEPKKGQAVLLRALQIVHETMPDVRLIMVGAGGPDLDRTRQLISELGILDRTELHVNIPHEKVPELMRRSDVFVMPSLMEPFGIALLEAGASGLPVVASRVGGIPELLEDGVTGLLVEPGNVSELAHKLSLILTDDQQADRLANAWRDRSAQWTWRRTCQQYLMAAEDGSSTLPVPD